MRRRVPTRIVVSAALMLVLCVLGGAASAYWGAAGGGAGSGGTDSAVAITLTPGAPTADLWPGGDSDVELTATNPNPFSVRIESLVLDATRGSGGFAVDVGHAACSVTAFGFSSQSNGGSGWIVPAQTAGVDGVLSVTLTNALTMAVDADNACQGSTATVFLTAGP